jgi:hypothetical protein
VRERVVGVPDDGRHPVRPGERGHPDDLAVGLADGDRRAQCAPCHRHRDGRSPRESPGLDHRLQADDRGQHRRPGRATRYGTSTPCPRTSSTIPSAASYTLPANFLDDTQRGIDLLSPVWNVLDLLPRGRGEWYAGNAYASH